MNKRKSRRISGWVVTVIMAVLLASCDMVPETGDILSPESQNGAIDESHGLGDAEHLSEGGEFVSGDAAYFEAARLDLFAGSDDLSVQFRDCVVGDEDIYVLATITDMGDLRRFEEGIPIDGWTEELKGQYQEIMQASVREELVVLDQSGQVKYRCSLSEVLPDFVSSVNQILVDDGGGLFLSCIGEYDAVRGVAPFYVFRLSDEGRLLGDGLELVPEAGEPGVSKAYSGLVCTVDGLVVAKGYASSDGAAVSYGFADVWNADGVRLFSVVDESGKVGGWSFGEGVIVDGSQVYFPCVSLVDGASFWLPLDVAGECLGEAIVTDAIMGGATVREGLVYSFSAEGVQTSDLFSGVVSPLFFWKDQDVSLPMNSTKIFVMSADKVLAVVDGSIDKWESVDGQKQETEFYLLSRAETNPNAGKRIIRIGGFDIGNDEFLLEKIASFNRESSLYRAEIWDYSWMDGVREIPMNLYDDKVMAVNRLVLSGEIPDILVGDFQLFDFGLYASEGLFADLRSLMHQDEGFVETEFLDLTFSLPEREGELFYLFPSFEISGLLTLQSTLAGKPGWNWDELTTLGRGMAEGQTLFPLDYSMSHESMLELFMKPYMADALGMNAESRGVDFRTEEFRKILDFSREFGMSEAEIGRVLENSPVSEFPVSMLLKQGMNLLSPTDRNLYNVESWKYLWNAGDGAVTATGFPNNTGNTMLCIPSRLVAISAKSKQQDAAWELMKAILSGSSRYMDDLPVDRTVFDSLMAEEMAPVSEEFLKESPLMKPLSVEGAEEFRRILGEVRLLAYSDSTILRIVKEESRAFFAGQKTVEETMDVIQNRVDTHLNYQS